VAAVEEIAPAVFELLEQAGIYLNSGLQDQIARPGGIPDHESAVPLKFEREVKNFALSLMKGKTLNFKSLGTHVRGGHVELTSAQQNRDPPSIGCF
jgi:hypothetical protein